MTCCDYCDTGNYCELSEDDVNDERMKAEGDMATSPTNDSRLSKRELKLQFTPRGSTADCAQTLGHFNLRLTTDRLQIQGGGDKAFTIGLSTSILNAKMRVYFMCKASVQAFTRIYQQLGNTASARCDLASRWEERTSGKEHRDRAEQSASAHCSLEVLLNGSVTAFSARPARENLVQEIDLALADVESAASTLKAADRSPVKQAFKLFRSRSSLKPNAKTETRVYEDENASAVCLAQEVAAGRNLTSLRPFEIVLLRRALQTRRNSLASISRLPTEVLAPILDLCPAMEADKPEFKTGKFILGLTVSHVCRRWREIAMKSSRFWSGIVLSRPRWALEMLHRSRAAPLMVGADFGSSATKNIAARDLVLAQLWRIRELHLNMPGYHVPAGILLPAPILERFHLWYEGSTPFLVTAKLFHGEVPRLQHLSLRNCLLHATSPLWDNLVSLELINAPMDLGMDEFLLIVLTRMPQLRALALHESFPEMLEATEPVAALNLETLELTATGWQCFCFLRAVSIPNCRIVLNAGYDSSDLRFLCDALESHRANTVNPVICALSVSDLPLTPTGASPFQICFFNRSNARPLHKIRLEIASALPNWREELMYTIMTIMSLDQINTLIVDCEALKLSTSLLHLKDCHSAAFHRDVSQFTDQLEGDPLMGAGDRFDPVSAAIHYPGLRNIQFWDIAFNERQMEVILDWLAQRKRLHLAIDKIVLEGCTLTNADLGSLREVVDVNTALFLFRVTQQQQKVNKYLTKGLYSSGAAGYSLRLKPHCMNDLNQTRMAIKNPASFQWRRL
ncbi:hypothetical protein B0H19DRAFT_1057373 [Mycena capillaripes]|nr:hypothetical protein B0H19DRAFT_1057373 [Mycena capillaripes]